MRFDKGLHSLLRKPYPVGYEAPATDGFNREAAHCQLGGLPGALKDRGRWLNDLNLPSTLELRVDLVPTWLEDGSAKVRLGENAPCLLYADENIIAEIGLEYAGTGQYQKSSGSEPISFTGTHFADYSLALTLPYIYEKKFLVQPKGRFIHWQPQWEQLAEGGQAPVLSFWAWGGQQMEKDIHPLVFSLDSLQEETKVCPTTFASLYAQGITPPHGGWSGATRIVFQDVFLQDQTRSLIQSLEAGMSLIFLHLGRDEKGEAIKFPYVSYRFANGHVFYKKGTIK